MRVKVVFVSPLKEEEKKLLVPSITANEDAGRKICVANGGVGGTAPPVEPVGIPFNVHSPPNKSTTPA